MRKGEVKKGRELRRDEERERERERDMILSSITGTLVLVYKTSAPAGGMDWPSMHSYTSTGKRLLKTI